MRYGVSAHRLHIKDFAFEVLTDVRSYFTIVSVFNILCCFFPTDLRDAQYLLFTYVLSSKRMLLIRKLQSRAIYFSYNVSLVFLVVSWEGSLTLV